ncbi:MAG: hypothetical protein WAN73_08605 [Methyloceanibacter sp.]
MSNAPLSDDELPAASDQSPEEEPSWLERVLARFGLGEEPDLREVIEDALTRAKGPATPSAGKSAPCCSRRCASASSRSRTSWSRAPTSSPWRNR